MSTPKEKLKILGDNKVPLVKKIRYAFGGAGDELPYALFYTYFMLFLTEVVGINAVIAGIISACAAAVDGLIDPALGILSDNLYNRLGTRRNMMYIGLGPLAVVTVLLFLPVTMTGAVEVIYYLIVSILFVTFYSLFTMNFVAMGGEITDDYNERNNIRFLVSIGAPLWAYLGHGGPQLMQVIFPDATSKTQWFNTGLSVTIIYLICCIIAVFVAPSVKAVKEAQESGNFSNFIPPVAIEKEEKFAFFANIKTAIKIQALRVEIFMISGFSLGNGFLYALIAYVLTFSMGLSASQQALFWAIQTGAYYIAIVGGVFVANVFGKKPLFIFCYAFAGITFIVFFFIGMHTVIAAAIFIIAFTCLEAPFWALYCTWGYEIADIDEFAYNKRRTSLILSIATVFNKLGPTVSFICTGLILTSVGYVEGGVAQAASVETGLHAYITLLPAACFIIGTLAAIRYPVTKRNFENLQAALMARNTGEEYSVDGFIELLPKDIQAKYTKK